MWVSASCVVFKSFNLQHVQPSTDPCFASLLGEYYGYISPEVTIRNITSVFQTGDMHIAVFDFAEQLM